MNIIAALILPFALQSVQAAEPTLQGPERFDQCVAAIEPDPVAAYEEAMAWAAEGQSLFAYRCAAMALLGQNRYAEGARRLESLSMAVGSHSSALRAEMFSQAGNAWLLDREPGQARSAFTRAIALMQGDRAFMPDLLIDRARAYAMEEDWRQAEEDLSTALDLRGDDALALRLRASARMHQSSFDLAEADALHSLELARTEDERVSAALALGHARESKRTGAPVDEQ